MTLRSDCGGMLEVLVHYVQSQLNFLALVILNWTFPENVEPTTLYFVSL